MKDILLDDSGDLLLQKFDLQLTDEASAIKQKIRRKLLCFQGEWYLDEEIGTPYFAFLGSKDIESILQMLRKAVLEVKGVNDISVFDVEINQQTRQANIKLEVTTDNGTVSDNLTGINI